MVKSRRPLSLLAYAVPCVVGASCATEPEILRVDDASISEAPHDGADASDGPPPNQSDAGPPLEILDVTTSGQGCPSGSWERVSGADGSLQEVRFRQFRIAAEPGMPVVRTTACNVSLRVRTPPNVSYALRSVEFVGEASLSADARATVLADVGFTGIGVVSAPGGRLDISQSGPFTFHHERDELSWAPCDITSNLQLRTRLTLDTTGSTKGDVQLSHLGKIRLQTGACPGRTPEDAGWSDAGTSLPPVTGIDAGPAPEPEVSGG